MSWLFHKKPGAASDEASHAPFAIHTMQDDLANAKSGKHESAWAQISGVPKQTSDVPITQQESSLSASHPFGVTPETKEPSRTDAAPISYIVSAKNNFALPEPEGNILVNQRSSGHKKLWLGVLIVALCLAIAAGILYFLFGWNWRIDYQKYKKNAWEYLSLSNTAIEKNAKSPETPELSYETAKSIVPAPQPFSTDKPNYLPFDTEKVSPEDIRATLLQITERITKAGLTEPIEFLVTDQNNNPLAFNRFAYLFQLEFNQDVLSLVQETFSLYAYDDTGYPRFSLALNFKDTDKETFAAIIKKIESGLPYALRPFFLRPDLNVRKTLVFQSSDYKQFQIRFTNIDIDQKIALDYAFYGNQLFLATSKDTLRAVLDKAIKTEEKK